MTQTAAIGPEIIIVDDSADEVMCDGGGGALGHPVVALARLRSRSVQFENFDKLSNHGGIHHKIKFQREL